MSPVFDLSQFMGGQANHGYDQLTFDAAHYSNSHAFIASQNLIFGHSSAGTTNLWDHQQNSSIPTLLASSYINDQITDSVTQ